NPRNSSRASKKPLFRDWNACGLTKTLLALRATPPSRQVRRNPLLSLSLPQSTDLLAAPAGSSPILLAPFACQSFAACTKTVFSDEERVVPAFVAVSKEGYMIGHMAALPARHPAIDTPFRRHVRDTEPDHPGPGRTAHACRAPDQV